MSAAQIPTAEHRFTALPPVSRSLRAEALRLYGSRAPGAPVRPAHLAPSNNWTKFAEGHADRAAVRGCPVRDDRCRICDREPGRHVASDEPTEAELREAAESADAELNGECAREGGDY